MGSLMHKISGQFAKYMQNVRPNGITYNYQRLMATFQPREFQYETSDGESGTLINRLARYISLNKVDYSDKTRYNIKYSQFYPVYKASEFMKLLRNIDNHDIPKLLVFTSIYRGKTETPTFVDVLNALDEECSIRIDQMNFQEIIKILHSFMFLIPNQITKLDTFQKAIPKLISQFETNQNHKEFMQLIFFMGMWKKNKMGTDYMRQFIHTHINWFLSDPEVNTTDFAILCNATFKTSVKIINTQFTDRLISEISNIQDDPSLLVTMVKSVRLQRLQSPLITDKLKAIVLNTKEDLDFRGYVHLFAYFADNLINDEETCSIMMNRCIDVIDKQMETDVEYKKQIIKAKDLSTFLWSCAYLNLNLNDIYDLKQVEEMIYQKIQENEYRNTPNELIDSVLSLWQMGYKSIDLISAIFANKDFTRVIKPERVKVESRKDLLLSAVEIEHPEAFKIVRNIKPQRAYNITTEAPEYLLKYRPDLQNIAKILEGMEEKLPIKNLMYTVPVKYLNIVGIYAVIDGRPVNFEVMDRTNSLADGENPTGLYNLKLRLLKKMDCDIISINTNKITDTEEQREYLEKEIQSFLGDSKKAKELKL